MIFVFLPLLIRLWAWEARTGRGLSTLAKLAFSFVCVGLGSLVLIAAAWDLAPGAKANPFWLVAYIAIVTIGELHLAPVGLALISRLAPPRVLARMMGLWLAATFPGDILGGWLGGFWSTMPKTHFFALMAAIAIAAGGAMLALTPFLRSILKENR
jgi:POT family proton-dependent oligopeptide transporter